MLDLFHRTYGAIFRRYPVLGRMAVVVLLGEVVFAAINNYALSFYVVDDLGRPASVVGILVSTFLIAEMLLKLPFGHLSDHYGRRRFAMYGLAVCVVGPLAVCAIPAHWFIISPALVYLLLMPLRMMDGAGAAALWAPLFASVPDHVPTQERAAAMSVMNTAYMAGLALGPTLAGVAMTVARLAQAPEHWVGKAPFAMAAGAAALGALVASRLPAAASVVAPYNGRPKLAVGNLRLVAIVIIITMGEMFATSTIAPYLALYVREVTGIHRSNVGFLLLLLFVPAVVLGIPIGHLSDRLPRRRVVQAALVTAAAGLWLVPVCTSLWTLVLVGTVVVIGFMFGLPSWLALITDLAPSGGEGRTMGLMATAQGLGAFFGPLAGGFIWRVSIKGPFYLSASVLTVAALAALIFLPRISAGGRIAGGEATECRHRR
jgi:MFS family permease